MHIEEIVWLEAIVDKLAVKHAVLPDEVEEALSNNPKFRFVERSDRANEDVYMALGRTNAGRYLTVLFIHKQNNAALILSGRNMADKEHKLYGRK